MNALMESMIIGTFAFFGVIVTVWFNVINKSRVEWIKEVRDSLELYIKSYQKVSQCSLEYLYKNLTLSKRDMDKSEKIEKLSEEIKQINLANIEFKAISNKLKTYFSRYSFKHKITYENKENIIIHELLSLMEKRLESYTKDLINNDVDKHFKRVENSDVLETKFTDDLIDALCEEISYNLKLSWEKAKSIS